MAQRTWLVRPDHEVDGIPAVSQQAVGKAVLDGVVVLDRAGGVLSVIVNRVPTGVPKERVTAAALVEWKSGTDAGPAPERDGPPVIPQVDVARNGPPEPVAVTAEREMPPVDERDVPPELREG